MTNRRKRHRFAACKECIAAEKRWLASDRPDQADPIFADLHTDHPQVHIEFNGRFACVDEEIAPLILALWQQGIPTHSSCQDSGGLIEIIGVRGGGTQLMQLIGELPAEWEEWLPPDRPSEWGLSFPRSHLAEALRLVGSTTAQAKPA